VYIFILYIVWLCNLIHWSNINNPLHSCMLKEYYDTLWCKIASSLCQYSFVCSTWTNVWLSAGTAMSSVFYYLYSVDSLTSTWKQSVKEKKVLSLSEPYHWSFPVGTLIACKLADSLSHLRPICHRGYYVSRSSYLWSVMIVNQSCDLAWILQHQI
jgi:hypothetical protein